MTAASRRFLARALGGALVLGGALAACRPGPTASNEPPDAQASPQASAIPAPLANVPTTTASASASAFDGGAPAQPMRPDVAPTADGLPAREYSGYTIQAVFRADEPPPAKGPEIAREALEAARRKNEARWSVDLGPSRARIVVQGPGFVLDEGTELRARSDRYGHVVVAPDGSGYRIAAPGALRALFGERRFDVSPLSPAETHGEGEGARRLGYRTRRVSVVNRAARATFEIAHVTDAGDGGALLCRALLDWMNAPPQTSLCGLDDVPMHAELAWTTRGTVVFSASSIVRRLDLTAAVLATPPPTATFGTTAFGPVPARALLTRQELHAIRSGEQPPDGQPSLTLVNPSGVLRYAWVDGAPVAWLAPGARLEIRGLAKGRATVDWRTFFADIVEPSQTLVLPAVSTVGGVVDER